MRFSCVLIIERKLKQPMDKKSTPELKHSIIKKALRSERMPSPSLTSLEFIRNFARNFRVCKGENGMVQDFVLN